MLTALVMIKSGHFWQFLKSNLLSCPIKKISGIDCPGCGFQRSVISLFEGDLAGSFKLFPPTIPLLSLLILTLVHLKFDLKHGAFFIKILFISTSLLILINYIYKIFTHQLI
ncbi:MAG: DUF2752 domain-containing protein [Pedobacter sp.]|nr:MAG: DUF2752 domain-containing protein [Pedobacter sp.]